MTIQETLRRGVASLQAARIETPLLDASILLAESIGITREKLFTCMPGPLSHFVEESYYSLIDRRLGGVPVAYLTGRKEFWGLDFNVDERVLIPRPDTEILVEKALEVLESDRNLKTVHDVCTGTGCIAVSIKHERPDLAVSASDISFDALAVFVENCRSILGKNLPCMESDLLESVPDGIDVITANPPYVESAQVTRMMSSGWAEPHLALDGGSDGLDLIRRLIAESTKRLNEGGRLIIEAGHDQADRVAACMEDRGFREVTIARDLAGRNRVTSGRLSWKNGR
jgi:release factor glutamine methyltransferase